MEHSQANRGRAERTDELDRQYLPVLASLGQCGAVGPAPAVLGRAIVAGIVPDQPMCKRVYLRSITIREYEQFKDCPCIEFSPEDNLILGVNGAGKTSLMRLLAAVLRFDYGALLDKPFDVAFEIVSEGDGKAVVMQGEARNQSSNHGQEHDVPQNHLGRSHKELIQPWQEHASLQLCVSIEHGAHDSLQYEVQGRQGTLRMAQHEIITFPVDMQYSLLDQLASVPLKPDSKLDLEGSLSDFDDLSEIESVSEADADFVPLVNDFDFRLIANAGVRVVTGTRPGWIGLISNLQGPKLRNASGAAALYAPHIYTRDSEFGLYAEGHATSSNTLAPVLDALGAEQISFRVKVLKEDTRRSTFECRGVEIRVRFRSGVEVIDSELTFGQKRLLIMGLLSRSTYNAPILIDEIDNGLHPQLVEVALKLLDGRQSFITSHNKLVVDLLNYAGPDDVQRRIHICRRHDDGSQTFEQLSTEQAQEVFEKIDVGILHPSDVLLNEGLW